MRAARPETPDENHVDQEDDGEQVERTLRTLDPTTTSRCQDFWLDSSHMRIVRRCASTRTAAAPKNWKAAHADRHPRMRHRYSIEERDDPRSTVLPLGGAPRPPQSESRGNGQRRGAPT